MTDDRKVVDNIEIEDATLILKNFRGLEGQYNEKGKRNFGVLLDDETAERLERDGWNVKYFKPDPNDPDGYRQPWLSVKVKYGYSPVIAQLITDSGKIHLDEETIGQLDWTEMRQVDLVIRPYNYPAMAGRPDGIAAYLKAIYVVVEEDRFARKYSDLPDLSSRRDDR